MDKKKDKSLGQLVGTLILQPGETEALDLLGITVKLRVA